MYVLVLHDNGINYWSASGMVLEQTTAPGPGDLVMARKAREVKRGNCSIMDEIIEQPVVYFIWQLEHV